MLHAIERKLQVIFPSDRSERLEDLRSMIDLITSITFFRKKVQELSDPPDSLTVVKHCVQNCIRTTYHMLVDNCTSSYDTMLIQARKGSVTSSLSVGLDRQLGSTSTTPPTTPATPSLLTPSMMTDDLGGSGRRASTISNLFFNTANWKCSRNDVSSCVDGSVDGSGNGDNSSSSTPATTTKALLVGVVNVDQGGAGGGDPLKFWHQLIELIRAKIEEDRSCYENVLNQ